MERVTVEIVRGGSPEAAGYLVGKEMLAAQEALAEQDSLGATHRATDAYACGVVDTIRWLRGEREAPYHG
jgi:hypothetical protein